MDQVQHTQDQVPLKFRAQGSRDHHLKVKMTRERKQSSQHKQYLSRKNHHPQVQRTRYIEKIEGRVIPQQLLNLECK